MKHAMSDTMAINYLLAQGAQVDTERKFIFKRNGFSGLKACSALDCLCNHHGYIASL